jgi:hypothetical protein
MPLAWHDLIEVPMKSIYHSAAAARLLVGRDE